MQLQQQARQRHGYETDAVRGSQGECSGRTEGDDSCTRGADHRSAEAPHGAYRSATEARRRAQLLSDGAATAELKGGVADAGS